MKLPTQTQLKADATRERSEERRRLESSRNGGDHGVVPSGECGCEHHCLGPCVLGNCLGTCTPF